MQAPCNDKSVQGLQLLKVDLNMGTALQWAHELGLPPQLPCAMGDLTKRIEVVNVTNETLNAYLEASGKRQLHEFTPNEKSNCLTSIAKATQLILIDSGESSRTNLALRLWAGCLSAAKTIAFSTLSGPNTRAIRASVFTEIDRIAEIDPIFHAGVEAAISFKRMKGEPYCLDGVPDNSPVRLS